MRVRVRRFSGLRKASEESRKAESVKVSNGERALQSGAIRQSPPAVRTTRRLCGEILTYPELPELRVPRWAAFPCFQIMERRRWRIHLSRAFSSEGV